MTARATRYSQRTNALAAEAVLVAAVEEAVGLLRLDRYPIRYILGAAEGQGLNLAVGTLLTFPEPEPNPVESVLLAAAQSAELLLARAEAPR